MSDRDESELLKQYAVTATDGEKLTLGARLAEHCYIDGLIRGRRVFSESILEFIRESFAETDAASIYSGFLSRMFALCGSGDVKSYPCGSGHHVFVHRDHAAGLEADIGRAADAVGALSLKLGGLDTVLLSGRLVPSGSFGDRETEASTERRVARSELAVAQPSAARKSLDLALDRLGQPSTATSSVPNMTNDAKSPSDPLSTPTISAPTQPRSRPTFVRKLLLSLAGAAGVSLLLTLPRFFSSFSKAEQAERYAAQRPGLKLFCGHQAREIGASRASLDRLEQELVERQQATNRIGQDLDSRRISIDRTSEAAVERFNEDLASYRIRAQENDVAVRAFRAKVAAHNKRVTSFNAACAEVSGTPLQSDR